ncbi:LacI family DNA-binding transcriptional regulator [Kineosporia succinea]|uniref:DNA-binding LacI/PurR family transcriptional regulator n=2 Tax=Kineosporia succinea TaxID=84632 RepID=A0ABT9P0N4_9ACTN|nr:DNA-binding LacI/PurR family transcriptional regulator [Kineosporia succinea]
MATMADVARLAGVSVSTVSYALSGTRPISLSTRRRIEQAMTDLGYTPNAFARGLKSKRSRIIALLFPARPETSQRSALEYVLGASDQARRRGYHLMLWTHDVEAVDDLAQFAGQGLVDGALLMEVQPHDPRIQVLVDAGVPFAMIGHNADPEGLDFIDSDFGQIAGLAVHHLVGMGHRRMAFVGGPETGGPDGGRPEIREEETGAPETIGAVSGWVGTDGAADGSRVENAIQRAATSTGSEFVSVPAERSADGGREAFTRLMAKAPETTVIIVFNEHAVPGIMRAAKDLGRRIPEDLSMMSIDMPGHVAELTTPPLTTVGASAVEIGRGAVDLLLRRLDGDMAPARQLLFRGELNLRGSCAPVLNADHTPGETLT